MMLRKVSAGVRLGSKKWSNKFVYSSSCCAEADQVEVDDGASSALTSDDDGCDAGGADTDREDHPLLRI